MDPRTGQLLGAGSALYIGQLVPGTGNPTQGLIQQGQQGTSKYGYIWPTVALAPRFGGAYDVTGNQRLVVRGGGGIFYDRPPGDSVQNLVSNPPFSRGITLRAVRVQDLAASQGGPVPASQIFAYRYDDGLPTSFQWNGGVQMTLPWASALDVTYVGQHAWNQQNATGAGANGQNLNAVDFGAAFLPQNQDPTLAANTTAGRDGAVPPTCCAASAATATSSSSRARSGGHSIPFRPRSSGDSREGSWRRPTGRGPCPTTARPTSNPATSTPPTAPSPCGTIGTSTSI